MTENTQEVANLPTPLPMVLKKHGYDMKQLVVLQGIGYIYEKSFEGHIVSYEVFRHVVQKELDVVLGGVAIHYDAKVKFPGDSEFGHIAWDCKTLPYAHDKLDIILNDYIRKANTNEEVTLTEEDDDDQD